MIQILHADKCLLEQRAAEASGIALSLAGIFNLPRVSQVIKQQREELEKAISEEIAV